jgi:hypothetical protein
MKPGDRGHVSTSTFGKVLGLVAYACSRLSCS